MLQPDSFPTASTWWWPAPTATEDPSLRQQTIGDRLENFLQDMLSTAGKGAVELIRPTAIGQRIEGELRAQELAKLLPAGISAGLLILILVGALVFSLWRR